MVIPVVNREEQFDGILKKAMPLILFSQPPFSSRLAEKTGKLFLALRDSDTYPFEEIYHLITDMIEKREHLEDSKEKNIYDFMRRNKSYDEQFQIVFSEIRNLKQQIKIKTRQLTPTNIDTSTKTDTLGKKLICPKCNYSWIYRGIGLAKRGSVQCPKCDHHWFVIPKPPKKGAHILCPHCNHSWITITEGNKVHCPKCAKFSKKVIK